MALGRGALRRGRPARRAGDRVDRLRHLPLVPRHGSGELLRPGTRRLPQRELRRHQGRPRGASGCRRHLPRGGQRLHPAPRLAPHGVHDARRQPGLRRHLLPARRGRWAAVVPRRPGGRDGCLDESSRRPRGDRPHPRRGDRDPTRTARRRTPARTGARRGRRRSRSPRGSRVRRLRQRLEVPDGSRAGLPRRACGGRRRSGGRIRATHAGDPRGLRAARPGGGWRVPLRGSSRLDRAALRTDAERQRPAARPGVRRVRPCRRGQRVRRGARRLPARRAAAAFRGVRLGARQREPRRRRKQRGRLLRAGPRAAGRPNRGRSSTRRC